MSGYFTEDTSVDAVNSRMGPDVSPRLAKVMAALVRLGRVTVGVSTEVLLRPVAGLQA